MGGGVKGHVGYSRKIYPLEQVSKRVSISLKRCKHCGSKNIKKEPLQIFQQVDIPEIKPIITQIELERGKCAHCKKNLVADFPKEYDHSSFGPRLVAFIGTASSVYRMSKRTTKAILETFFGIDISLGSIPAMEKKISKGLESSYEKLAKRIDMRKVAYVDETGFRQDCKTHYIWTATTEKEALIRVLPTRGIDSLNKIRPRSNLGITVTDRYQVYNYKKHQFCLAHIRRNLQKFSQRDGPDGILGQRALFELKEIFAACRLSCRRTMQQRISYRKKRLKEILCDVIVDGTETFFRFADRLLNQFHKLFLFARYSEVDCTNNAAERTLRHVVMWRKTSYGTQSDSGSRFLERAISIWMTLKKQHRNIFPYFKQAYQATFDPTITEPVI